MLLQENGRILSTEGFNGTLFSESSMPITDINVIKFSDQRIRIVCDMLARAYYKCDEVRDRWDALGGDQPALDIMQNDIKAAADAVMDAYFHCVLDERIWFVGDGTNGINILTPNTVDTVVDGSPADGRSTCTGQKIHAAMERVVQWQNWLLNNAGGQFGSAARDGLACLNTVVVCSKYGQETITLSNAGNFLTRCSELRTEYEANSGLKLATILNLAVNPQ
jgi:hypothetical protein